jgi:hypothetical protein
MFSGFYPQATSFDCRRFLEQVLPELFCMPGDGISDFDAIIQFEVTDLNGYCVHYHFHQGSLDVRQGKAPQADLEIALGSTELAALSRNELHADEALKSARLKVAGDDRLLLWLADRLAAAETP